MISKSTCVGADIGNKCFEDTMCNPGLFCNKSKVCMKVSRLGDTCHEDLRCEFGSLCVNSTCIRKGSLPVLSKFIIEDNEIFRPTWLDLTRYAAPACSTFAAIKTNERTPYPDFDIIYQCISGFEKKFDSYRVNETSRICEYQINFGNGTLGPVIIEAPTCGYNLDNSEYCPMKRNEKEHIRDNSLAVETWSNAPTECHHRSTIVACPYVQSNKKLLQDFKRVLVTDWITTDNNWALIAGTSRGVGRTVLYTREYFSLTDDVENNKAQSFAEETLSSKLEKVEE